jgi:hypothetical protein
MFTLFIVVSSVVSFTTNLYLQEIENSEVRKKAKKAFYILQ